MWDQIWPFAILGMIAVGAFFWWRYVTKPRLTRGELEEISKGFLAALRDVAPGPNENVRFTLKDWRAFGLSNYEAIEVSRYLVSVGKVTLPGFSIQSLLTVTPPEIVAPTMNTWEEYGKMNAPVFNGPINGPVYAGDNGTQNIGVINYGVEQAVSDMHSLAFDLYTEASTADELLASRLEKAAQTISESAEVGDLSSPKLKSALRWLSSFANNTSAGVVSAGIVAAATAILQSIG